MNVDQIVKEEQEKKTELLGQVFTPKKIAELMVSMALKNKPKSILDPCFGEGVFLKEVFRKLKYKEPHIFGIEIDSELFYEVNNRLIDKENLYLFNKNFFEVDNLVDCIIMNPPYIRHEDLNNTKYDFLDKNKILEKIKFDVKKIDARSNLYVYFFVKSIELLKEDGEIIAIVPNTWMSAKFGEKFKNILFEYFSILEIITFEKDVFENADVDSCIIHLKKTKKQSDTKIVLLNHESAHGIALSKTVDISTLKKTANWMNFFKENIDFSSKNFIELKEIVKIRRGISTNYNKFFLEFPTQLINNYPDYFTKILCTPKEIMGYSSRNTESLKKIFITDLKKNTLPSEISNYISQSEEYIIANKDSISNKGIIKKIESKDEKWFMIAPKKPSDFLFGYIIRDEKKFIVNEENLIARDNFYEITLENKNDSLILFAILNSNISSLLLENIGRNNGKGLLKIQKYELDQLKIINPKIISKKDRIQLEMLAKDLLNENIETVNRSSIISDIDKVLFKYTESIYSLEKMYQTLEYSETKRKNNKR